MGRLDALPNVGDSFRDMRNRKAKREQRKEAGLPETPAPESNLYEVCLRINAQGKLIWEGPTPSPQNLESLSRLAEQTGLPRQQLYDTMRLDTHALAVDMLTGDRF